MGSQNGSSAQVEVAVIGAGFSGIGMAVNLMRAGIHDFVVLEAADDVGGTWRANTYPGCQCDIPSNFYSFSFALNPDWSRTFPLQEEIWDYLRGVVDRSGVRPHLRLRTPMESAEWDEGAARWRIQTADGPLAARHLVAGFGPLSVPRMPALLGIDAFEGDSFHSAEWDHSVDLRGKRVAVLGTGASAVQIVPTIQPDVAHLGVFQRSAPWVLPHKDRPVRSWERALYRRVPGAQMAMRAWDYVAREWIAYGMARDLRLLRLGERMAEKHREKQIADPALRERVTPRYRLGCKRVIPSNLWYPALQQPNVELVTDGISEITARGIRTADGTERDFDVIVYATGFEVAEFPPSSRVTGKDGRTLHDVWDEGVRAYKGTTVAGFPNFWMMLGPNTILGHSSVVYMAESQMAYVVDALRTLGERGARTLEVRPEAQAAWNDELEKRLEHSVWMNGNCTSWYLDRFGKNVVIWPDFTFAFRRRLRHFDPAAYRVGAQPLSTSTRGSSTGTLKRASV